MWTDEARVATLIFQNARDRRAAAQMYLASFYIGNLKRTSKDLDDAKDTLDFHNFARSQSCHLTEGIFGSDIHAAKMESAKARLFGLLGNYATDGYMFLQSLTYARAAEKEKDWNEIAKDVDLKALLDLYRRTRNACMHLADRIHNQVYATDADFSIKAYEPILKFKDEATGTTMQFDCSRDSTSKMEGIWMSVLSMLDCRHNAFKAG